MSGFQPGNARSRPSQRRAENQDLADRLDISLSTAHQAVQRLIDAGLADEKRRAHRQALLKGHEIDDLRELLREHDTAQAVA